MSDSSTHWNLNEHLQLQLPHPDHPEEGHTNVVYGLHLQNDSLVSVSADHTVRMWDLSTQRLLLPPLVGHTGSVTAVQCDAAADEDVIVTGDTNGTVIVWRFSTGEVIKTITEAHDETVLSLNFDNRYLATAGKDKKIKLWNRHSLDINNAAVPAFAVKPTETDYYEPYSLFATLEGHNAAVNTINLTNNTLVSGSGDSTITIWSLQTGQSIQSINTHQSGIASLHHNTRYIVSGSSDNTAQIYDVERRVKVARLEGHTNVVRVVKAVFDESGEVETVVTGSYDGSVRVWERGPGAEGWRTRYQFDIGGFQAPGDVQSNDGARDYSDRVFALDFDDKRFVCSGQGPMIRVWDFRLPSK